MPKICYVERKFEPGSLKLVEIANAIIKEYTAQGFDLTLRQLYYQFVARDIIRNKQQEYKRLGSIINDARLAGLIDWNAIVDRTRELRELSHWTSPSEIVNACVRSYRLDKWANQAHRVEVWIEKDALVGVIEGVCQELDVAHFSCRGYTSQSEMWEAAQRLKRYAAADPRRKAAGGHLRQTPVIIHLGDHDPSGIDMSRDIEDRLRLFGCDVEFHRIALNMNQVQKYNPPPNPCKITDSRARGYIDLHGHESWELDALDPKTLAALIRKKVSEYIDEDALEVRVNLEADHKERLEEAAEGMSE